MKRIIILWVFAAVLAATCADICDIAFPAQTGRQPETFGLPLAAGTADKPEQLQLIGNDGCVLPLQVRVNARWPDGSLKWVLLDTQIDGGFSGKLTTGSARAEQPDLAVRKDGGIVIDTGRITLEIPADGPLFSYRQGNESGSADLTMALQHDAPGPTQEENWLLDAGNARNISRFGSAADKERRVELEENGPLRTCVKISGWFMDRQGKKGYQYILRLSAYRDMSRLRLQTTFVATEDVNRNFLRGMVLRINRPSAEAAAGKERRKIAAGQVFSILAPGIPRFYHLVSYKDRKAPVGTVDFLTGGKWQTLSSGEDIPAYLTGGRLAAVVKDFVKLFPKELSVDSKGLDFHIWPERIGKVLDLRRREQIRAEYLDYQNPDGGMGVAKTHELYLDWDCPNPSELAQAVNNPAFPVLPVDYYRNTLACGEFLVRNPESFPRVEAAIDFIFKYLHRLRYAACLDGMMNWGDVSLGVHDSKDHMRKSHPEGLPFRGYTGWANNDLAIAHGYFLQYLRTGDRQVLRDGIEMTWHVLDVDTVHYMPGKPDMVGLGRRHDQQHWGSGIEYGFAIDSAMYLYLLTGEHRALDVLKETAGSSFFYGRYVLVRLWEVTGNEAYKRKAENFLRQNIDMNRDYPFSHNDFRVNAYDSPGYIFYDSILPNDLLKQAAVKAGKSLHPTYASPYLDKGHPPYGIMALACKYDPSKENMEILKIMVKLLNYYLPKQPSDLDIAADAPMAKYDELNREIAHLENTSVAGLMLLTALPYALEQLRKAGVTEDECLNFQYDWIEPASYTEILKTSTITPSPYPQYRNGWSVAAASSFPDWLPGGLLKPEAFRKWQKAISRYKLYENDRLIGPTPYGHIYIMQNGLIGWSHGGGNILFSTSDNSNPAENGRTYRLVYTSAADWKWEDKPSFSEKLPPDKIYPYPDIKAAPQEWWCCSLVNESPDPVCIYPEPPEIQQLADAALKRHAFTENGKPLAHWRRDQNLVIFKTSDGSDPRTNGREYRLQYTRGAQ